MRMLRRSLWGFPIGFRRLNKDGRLFSDFAHIRDWGTIFQLFENSDIPDDYKEKSRRAFEYLRNILGDTWIASPKKGDHPLGDILCNPVSWCAGLISDIASMIGGLEDVLGFDKLKQRVSTSQSCQEALSVAHAAALLRRCGIPKALWRGESGKEREDLLVEIDKLPLLLEITCPMSELAKQEIRIHSAIMLPVESRWMKLTGRIIKPLSNVRREEAKRLVMDAINKVEQTGRAQDVHMNRAFDLTIHPRSSNEKYRVEGFPFAGGDMRRVRETERIRKEIRNKAKQASKYLTGSYSRGANAIMIYSDPWYFGDILDEGNFAETLVSDLEESVYDFEKVTFMGLVFIGLAGGDQTKHGNGYFYRAKTTHEAVHQRILIIQNEYAEHRIPDDQLRRLAE